MSYSHGQRWFIYKWKLLYIVPAFLTYHFMHFILHKSFHHHASASYMFFAYLLFSCLLMHDPCVFLCKTKTKKGSMKVHTAFLVACVRYHEDSYKQTTLGLYIHFSWKIIENHVNMVPNALLTRKWWFFGLLMPIS